MHLGPMKPSINIWMNPIFFHFQVLTFVLVCVYSEKGDVLYKLCISVVRMALNCRQGIWTWKFDRYYLEESLLVDLVAVHCSMASLRSPAQVQRTILNDSPCFAAPRWQSERICAGYFQCACNRRYRYSSGWWRNCSWSMEAGVKSVHTTAENIEPSG